MEAVDEMWAFLEKKFSFEENPSCSVPWAKWERGASIRWASLHKLNAYEGMAFCGRVAHAT